MTEHEQKTRKIVDDWAPVDGLEPLVEAITKALEEAHTKAVQSAILITRKEQAEENEKSFTHPGTITVKQWLDMTLDERDDYHRYWFSRGVIYYQCICGKCAGYPVHHGGNHEAEAKRQYEPAAV